MSRALSALVAIGGFGVAVATLSVATTAAIVLLAPQPPATRMTANTAIAALRGAVAGYERRIDAAPPPGTRARFIEQALGSALGRPPGEVRAVWLDGVPARTPIAGERFVVRQVEHGSLTTPPVGRPQMPFVLVGRPNGNFRMVAPTAAGGAMRAFLLGLPMPAFSASVRQRDGRWLSVRPVQPVLSGWRLTVLIAFAVSLLLLAPLAWLFARRLTRPFRALAGALGERADAVPDEGPRELREAAGAIAAMRTRLAAEASERARMLTAIAHDLRTPLTGLRLRIETVSEPQRTRMVADVERMQAMIGEVLAFARDAAAPADRVEVRALLRDIVADFDAGGAAIRIEPGDDATIAVPRPAFRRVIENLLRNALDYAGGGTIRLEREAGDIVVSVSDAGPGIPAADRERLLRPFERGDASRNRGTGGAGLGLSIVRDFAAQNRGTFVLSDAAGGGTVATLRLQAA